jgi:hypothetical protein
MKIVLGYDPILGNILDKNGVHLCTFYNLQDHEQEEKTGVDVNQLVKLKVAGFTVDEIVALKDRGLI